MARPSAEARDEDDGEAANEPDEIVATGTFDGPSALVTIAKAVGRVGKALDELSAEQQDRVIRAVAAVMGYEVTRIAKP